MIDFESPLDQRDGPGIGVDKTETISNNPFKTPAAGNTNPFKVSAGATVQNTYMTPKPTQSTNPFRKYYSDTCVPTVRSSDHQSVVMVTETDTITKPLSPISSPSVISDSPSKMSSSNKPVTAPSQALTHTEPAPLLKPSKDPSQRPPVPPKNISKLTSDLSPLTSTSSKESSKGEASKLVIVS